MTIDLRSGSFFDTPSNIDFIIPNVREFLKMSLNTFFRLMATKNLKNIILL